MNPLKSYVRHALEDSDPEPDIDRPRLRANQTPGGQIQIYEPETNAWIGCEPEDCLVCRDQYDEEGRGPGGEPA